LGLAEEQKMLEDSALDLMTGVVRTWLEDRGFGFITPDGSKDDVFVHRSVLSDGESLVEGCPVMFDLTYDTERKGFKATKCIGAIPAPVKIDENGEVEEGGRKGGWKGGAKGGNKGVDPLYRRSFVDDPWANLYTPAMAHLRAHLEDSVETSEPANPKKKDKAKGKGKTQKAASVAEKAAPEKPTEARQERDVVAETPQAPVSDAQEAPTKVEPKTTSIYDFFNDEEDALLY